MTWYEYAELVEQFEREWQEKVAQLPLMLGFNHLDLKHIGQFQRGNVQLATLFDVPEHVLRALRLLLLIRNRHIPDDSHHAYSRLTISSCEVC